VLELEEDDPQRLMQRTREIWMYKRNSQPLNTKNAGCVFKNPRGLKRRGAGRPGGAQGLAQSAARR